MISPHPPFGHLLLLPKESLRDKGTPSEQGEGQINNDNINADGITLYCLLIPKALRYFTKLKTEQTP